MSISFERHASEEVLERYSLGVLSEAETEPFEEHLLICPVCQDRLEEMDAFVGATRRAAEKVLSGPPRSTESWWRRLFPHLPWPKTAWASVVAGMALLLVTFAATWGIPRPGEVTPVSVLLESARGIQDASGARAPAGKPLVLQLNLAELPRFPSYALELVDWRGQHVLASAAPRHNERVSFRVGKLAAGRYWVRLYDPSPQRELLREFGLEATKN
jgi:anti-sigma factor RsiW